MRSYQIPDGLPYEKYHSWEIYKPGQLEWLRVARILRGPSGRRIGQIELGLAVDADHAKSMIDDYYAENLGENRM